ncbi:MAG: aminotransferase class V-fold PLP-dependent enzyme, partial [Alphaproteobacteria bacterium]|nr:aminotransferase class V-fold PLP-dependent enzyme [Alphaproteobacteria bacterium]
MSFSDKNNLGVYLDYNATSPLRSEAKRDIFASLDEPSNPSSIHRFGRRARKRLEKSRVQIAKLVGAEPENIIFTSGGT